MILQERTRKYRRKHDTTRDNIILKEIKLTFPRDNIIVKR